MSVYIPDELFKNVQNISKVRSLIVDDFYKQMRDLAKEQGFKEEEQENDKEIKTKDD